MEKKTFLHTLHEWFMSSTSLEVRELCCSQNMPQRQWIFRYTSTIFQSTANTRGVGEFRLANSLFLGTSLGSESHGLILSLYNAHDQWIFTRNITLSIFEDRNKIPLFVNSQLYAWKCFEVLWALRICDESPNFQSPRQHAWERWCYKTRTSANGWHNGAVHSIEWFQRKVSPEQDYVEDLRLILCAETHTWSKENHRVFGRLL